MILEQWPVVEYAAVMDGDEGVDAWMRQVAIYGFCIVTGTPATTEATEMLVRRAGYVRETIFGGFWDFQADLSKADTAYTNLELLPHTDGTYSHDAPGLQLLHCLAFDGTGGQSTMVDGFRIASELRAAEPDLYDVLSRVEVPGQYIGDGSHLMASRPVFRHDRAGELVQVSFNNADRAPFLLPAPEMELFYDALRAFEALANDHRLQWRRVNPPGRRDAVRQLARAARPHRLHRPPPSVRRLHQPRGLREPAQAGEREHIMSENLRHYTTIMFGFEHVLRLVPESAWSNASPCDEWNARQVAGHAMSVVNNIAARGGVGTVVDPFADLDAIAGDDPLASFRRDPRSLSGGHRPTSEPCKPASPRRSARCRSTSTWAGCAPTR